VQKQRYNLFYVAGPNFVQAIIDKKGITGVNEAFDAPPTSTRQILNPTEYLIPSTAKTFDCTKLIEKVAQKLPTDGMQSQSSQLGPMNLTSILVSQGIPEEEANSVAGECLSGASFTAARQTQKAIMVVATFINFTTCEAVANYVSLMKKIEKSQRDQAGAMLNVKLNIVKDEAIRLEGFDSARFQQVQTKVDDQLTTVFSVEGTIGNQYAAVVFINPEQEQPEKSLSDILTYMNKERQNIL